MIHWTDVNEQLPPSVGEYLVTYHPCYWNSVRNDEFKVGLDAFRGKTTWAKNKYQRVIAWAEIPEPFNPNK